MIQQHGTIPARSRQANEELIDLTAYYTAALDDGPGKAGANLASLPGGVQAFGGIAFDVRGLVQPAGLSQPVTGIRVDRTGRRLNFLHATAGRADEGAEVGAYVLHYADGRTQRLPLIYGLNIRDARVEPGEPVLMAADVAWTGESAAGGAAHGVQLHTYSVNNPFPDIEIATVDVVSANAGAAPFLVALTVERNDPTYEGGFHTAGIDRFCPIAPRSPDAGPDLVDLSAHYNASLDDNWFHHAGHDLRDLPRGVQVFGSVPYDVRGLVQVSASKMLEVTGTVYPEAVTGIQVHRKGARLHFLQGCFWNTEPGAKIGEYVVHYADGQTRSAPILYGRNIMDWWMFPDGAEPTEAKVVWQGVNPATHSMGMVTQLTDYAWDNPLPDVEIESIDVVSAMIEAGPFLVALTVTP